jgi:hypothetical protein
MTVTQDVIEVIWRKLVEQCASTRPEWHHEVKCLVQVKQDDTAKALTASGYVITTQARLDGLKAAHMAEAAKKAYTLWDGEQEDGIELRDAILALATTPPTMVCVPVTPTAEIIEAGIDAFFPGDEVVYPDEWETVDQAIIAAYRAMTATGEKDSPPPETVI